MTAYCRMTEVIPLKRKLFLVCFAGKERFLWGDSRGWEPQTSTPRQREGLGARGQGLARRWLAAGTRQPSQGAGSGSVWAAFLGLGEKFGLFKVHLESEKHLREGAFPAPALQRPSAPVYEAAAQEVSA